MSASPASPRLQVSAARRLSCSASSRRSHATLLRPAQLRLGLLRQRQEVRGVAPSGRVRLAARLQPLQARTRGSSPASRSAARRQRRRPGAPGSWRRARPAPSSTSSRRSPSRSQTASAASSVQPPTKTAEPAEQRPLLARPAGRSSRRWCRAASAAGPAGRARRRSAAAAPLQPRAASPRGGSSRMRAAASSIASGSPSRRAQISATAGGVLVGQREVRPGRAAPAGRTAPRPALPETTSAGVAPCRASGSASGGTANSCSPRRRSGARLVTSTFRPGQAASRSATTARRAGPARSCRAAAGGTASAGTPSRRPRSDGCRRPGTPSAWAMVDGTSAGSRDRGQLDQEHAVLEVVQQVGRDLEARRVFPVPPGPVSVTSRDAVPAAARARPPARARARAARSAGPAGCGAGVQRPSGGKSAGRSGADELEDALGPGQVLEPMLARGRSRPTPSGRASRDQRRSSPRRAAPGRRGPTPAEPRAAVDGRAVVVAVALLGLAGVQRHPHPDRAEASPTARPRSALDRQRRRDGVRAARERRRSDCRPRLVADVEPPCSAIAAVEQRVVPGERRPHRLGRLLPAARCCPPRR